MGSISGGAGSPLDSTLLLQTPKNAHAGKMLLVIPGGLVLPSQERTVDPFIWYLQWDQVKSFTQLCPFLGSTSHKDFSPRYPLLPI